MNSIIQSEANAQAKAYEAIKQQILRGDLPPNSRLKALDIAETLGISRTPVREALGRLEQEGLVASESGWGYIVRAMNFAEVMDLYKVREVLEVESALEAIPRIDDAVLHTLEKILADAEAFAKRGRPIDLLAATRKFHATVAAATGNRILQQMLSMISDRIQILGAMVLRQDQRRPGEIIKENAAILMALRQKDPVEAEGAVRAHVRRARETVGRFFMDQRSDQLYLGRSNGGSTL